VGAGGVPQRWGANSWFSYSFVDSWCRHRERRYATEPKSYKRWAPNSDRAAMTGTRKFERRKFWQQNFHCQLHNNNKICKMVIYIWDVWHQ